jgi:hypothetical protein
MKKCVVKQYQKEEIVDEENQLNENDMVDDRGEIWI